MDLQQQEPPETSLASSLMGVPEVSTFSLLMNQRILRSGLKYPEPWDSTQRLVWWSDCGALMATICSSAEETTQPGNWGSTGQRP